nr:MAG TPA: 4Fe-4S single cluster domain protein [Bacteriophage sp.]
MKFRKLMSYYCKSADCEAFCIFCRTIVELL